MINNGVTSVGVGAFSGCSGISSVTLPDSVKTIRDKAFQGCSGITEIALPGSLTQIGDYAFYGCEGLTSVAFPLKLVSIGMKAFRGCENLQSVNIPVSLTTILDEAFNLCDSLSDVYYQGTESQWAQISIGSLNIHLTTARKHYNSAAPVASATLSGSISGTTLTYTAKNVKESAYLVVAWYDADGTMLGMKLAEITAADNVDKTLEVGAGAKTYKLMLVSSGTFSPLCKAYEIG